MTRTIKSAATLAFATVLVMLLAVPTSATPTNGTVASGTVSVNLTPPLSVGIGGGGGGGGCAAASLTVDITSVTGTAPNRAATGTVALSIPEGPFDFSSAPNNLHVLVATAAGTLNLAETGTTDSWSIATGSTVSTNTTTNQASVFARTGACTPTTFKRCGPVITTVTLTGTFSGTVAVAGIAGTANVNGTGTLAAFGCTAPFSAINGKTLTLASLVVNF
ncbi:MAG TPA: hypothetical protein VF228_12640 [Iamia sp.]